KNIEHLYKDKRAGEVATAMDSVVYYERWLELWDGDDWQTSKTLADIRAYNKEDCDSTWLLAEWLRALQREHGRAWTPRQRAEPTQAQSDAVGLRAEVQSLAAKMLEDIAADGDKKTGAMSVREILAYLLEFHWREAKPVFWAKYDRAAMTEDEMFEDVGCLAGLIRRSALR
ncbi:MAG: ribonuclease H-like domain-containing protein, partial [Cyanobacteria bacterium REEB67]|nr:ribonuclease H-like domain-containing protein [Cyanobacteria bacterium REEB67]